MAQATWVWICKRGTQQPANESRVYIDLKKIILKKTGNTILLRKKKL